MDKKILIGLFILILIIIFLNSCAVVDINEKKACEDSGGTYEKGFGETSRAFYYCKCPIDMYETDSNKCKNIGGDETQQCVSLSNEYVICKNSDIYNDYYDEGTCVCVFENGEKTYLAYKKIVKCNCTCDEDYCGCVCLNK